VVAALPAHVRLGDAPKLGVQQRENLISGLWVGLRLCEQTGKLIPGTFVNGSGDRVVRHGLMRAANPGREQMLNEQEHTRNPPACRNGRLHLPSKGKARKRAD
jgi:hypothetical protein